MLTHQRIRDVLSYDEATGEFRWRLRASSRADAGALAGRVQRNGYRYIKVDGRDYRAHRLAWFYVHGVWPVQQVDHIDGDKLNNAISNLRDVSASENRLNIVRANKNNRGSGFPGVYRNGRRWQGLIGFRKKRIHVGMFETPEAASAAVERVRASLLEAP